MSGYIPAYQVAANYDRPTLQAQPKPKPRKLVKDKAKASVATTDKQERAKCHARSGGRCEVIEVIGVFEGPVRYIQRCKRHASENHHLIGGSGRRNRGRSILAAHRLDCCQRCHRDIGGNVLVPDVEQAQAECAATVRYERVRMVTERRR